MLEALLSSVYGSTPAEFVSDYSIEESVARLSRIVKRFVFFGSYEGQLVGKVKRSRARLQRVGLFHSRNLRFIGSFYDNGEQVTLSGRFTTHTMFKVMIPVCVAFSLFVTLRYGPEGVAILLVGVATVWLYQSMAQDDVEWISSRIRAALTKDDN